MRRGNRHALGAIYCRPAADCNQTITATRLVQRGSGAHCGLGRVGGGLVKHAYGQAGQGVECFLQDACCFDTGIGHDQRPADADALALLLEQLDGAKFKLDLGHVIDEGHGLLSFCVVRCGVARDQPNFTGWRHSSIASKPL